MLKIAIIGGAGMIGARLTQAYLDAGHDVCVIDSLAHGVPMMIDPRARFYRVDVREARLRSILQLERPEIVSYHVAQHAHLDVPFGAQPVDDADIHIRGLLNTLESCVMAQVGKVIFASGGNDLYCGLCPVSAAVSRFTEDAPLCPRKPRDISKVAGEWYVRFYTHQYGLPHTVLRYADVYGETVSSSEPHPLNDLLHALRHGHRPVIRHPADDVRDHIYAGDVVKANLLALARGQNQTIHISTGEGHTLKELQQMAATLLHSEQEPLTISQPLDEPSSMILDNSLAYRVLGWQPEVGLAEGLRRVVESMRGDDVLLPESPARESVLVSV